ncbi:MAG TPA: hypothetical protein VNQ79_28070 [Blastocatellia bacterium]|nr:hypothetical protein [Blastocatellia bacterium]
MNIQTETAEIPLRPPGRTGVRVTALGMGGYDLGTMADATEAIRLVLEAIDAGITTVFLPLAN